MNALPKGVEEITKENKQFTLSPFTASVSSRTITIILIGVVVISNYTSDVYFLTQDQSISTLENNYVRITLDLTCSSSGSTSISYSLVEYNENLIPNWASIDSSSGVLTLNTPDVYSDTEYNLWVSSTISGVSTPVLKQIKLLVQNKLSVPMCIVVNWNRCSKTNRSYWDACNSDYNLDSGQCYLPKPKIESKKDPNIGKTFCIVMQVFAWITLAICLIWSYMNPSSISILWSMISQLQFFFLGLFYQIAMHNWKEYKFIYSFY